MVANMPSQEDLDWISLRNELDADKAQSPWSKGWQKCKDAPLVPVGCLATVAALSYGIWSFSQGRSKMSHYMMRARVIAQTATVFAILFSLNAIPNRKN